MTANQLGIPPSQHRYPPSPSSSKPVRFQSARRPNAPESPVCRAKQSQFPKPQNPPKSRYVSCVSRNRPPTGPNKQTQTNPILPSWSPIRPRAGSPLAGRPQITYNAASIDQKENE
jgi:hypothetical protein